MDHARYIDRDAGPDLSDNWCTHPAAHARDNLAQCRSKTGSGRCRDPCGKPVTGWTLTGCPPDDGRQVCWTESHTFYQSVQVCRACHRHPRDHGVRRRLPRARRQSVAALPPAFLCWSLDRGTQCENLTRTRSIFPATKPMVVLGGRLEIDSVRLNARFSLMRKKYNYFSTAKDWRRNLFSARAFV